MKKLKPITLALFLTFQLGIGQSLKKSFSKLSGPEKCWVIFHPFKAKRAFKISKEAERISDSIRKTPTLDQDKNGGQIDAFRHAFWMATLSQKIGKRAAKSLGKAHERGNYKQFKKNKKEDGMIPDATSSEMDLQNNVTGISIYKSHKKASQKQYIVLIITEILKGNLKIIKKDKKGNYLNCKGRLLSLNELKGIWTNSKCIIPSKKQE